MRSSWARPQTKGQLTSPPHTCGVSSPQPHSSGGLGGFLVRKPSPRSTPLGRGPSPAELDSYTEITGVLCHVMFCDRF